MAGTIAGSQAQDRVCLGCGGPVGHANTTGFCSKTLECRKRAQATSQKRYYDSHSTTRRESNRKRMYDYYRTIRGFCKSVRYTVHRNDPNSDITLEFLEEIWTGTCGYCDTKLQMGDETSRSVSPNLDRIIPTLGYRIGNVQWLCGCCNRRKQEMTSTEMRQLLEWQTQAEQSIPQSLLSGDEHGS